MSLNDYDKQISPLYYINITVKKPPFHRYLLFQNIYFNET